MLYWLAIPTALLAFVFYKRYQNQTQSRQDKLQYLDQKFNKDPKIHNGEIIVYHGKTGHRHHIQKGPIEPFHYIASITKLYTHALIYQLMDQGKLNGTDTLEQLLSPEYYQGILGDSHDGGSISVQELLDQNSGLVDYETDYKVDGKDMLQRLSQADFEVTFEDAIEITKNLNSNKLPLKENQAYYSNLNALLLGQIAEENTGESLKKLYENNIFEPLQMSNTFIADEGQPINPINIGDLTAQPIKYVSSAVACGGLVSTMDDLFIFLQGFMTGKLFDKSHLENVIYRSIQFFPVKYGGGMMYLKMNPLMSPLFPTPPIMGHSGSTGSFAFYAPDTDAYIVGTINQIKHNPYQYIFTYLDAIQSK